MKSTPILAAALLATLALTSGCASRVTASGGRETNLLGGAVTVATKSFQPANPATVDVDVTKIAGAGNPSGTKVSLLWGLLTFNDH